MYTIDIIRKVGFMKMKKVKNRKSTKMIFRITCGNQKISFDAVFIGMHGTPGEDGKLQGYFDVLGHSVHHHAMLPTSATYI